MLRHTTNAATVSPAPEMIEGTVGDADVSPSMVASETNHLLAPYFRDLAHVGVMTKEEEVAAAVRISELRRQFWRSILSYPPFVDGICELAAEVLPDETCPRTQLETLRRTSRALRDRDLLQHQRAFETAREELAEAMGLADVDSAVSDRILADLTSVEQGVNQGLSMKVKLPRRGSAPFFQYVTTVRREHHALVTVKNAFVRANLRLVVTIARRYNHGKMPLQDLIQEGNIGLMKAVDRFDHRKGFRFSTYGSWWIRHAISRSIADKARSVRLPVHMIDAYNRVNRARREFEALHGRKATDEELASLTGVSPERIARMRWSLVEAPISLDAPLSDESGLSLLDAVEDTTLVAPSEQMDASLMLDQLEEVFAKLSPIEADILRKRMGLGEEQELTLKEIGDRYSLSRERIRQLQEQALAKLRGEFRRRNLL